MYAKAIRILTKGYLTISLITPSKLQEILNAVQMAICKTNLDYDIVIKRLHLYYDMKLVTFGINKRLKFNSSVSSLHSAIHPAVADTASDRDSTSCHYRSK